MDGKNLFTIATDDTKQALFRESLRAVCEAAERQGVRRVDIADAMLNHACWMMGEAKSLTLSEPWLEKTIAALKRCRDYYRDRMALLESIASQQIRDAKKAAKAAARTAG